MQQLEGSTRLLLPREKRPIASESGDEDEEEEEEKEEEEGSDDGPQAERMAEQTGRFGRLGVADIVQKSGTERLEAAKEQIAIVGAEILGGGELVDIVSIVVEGFY